MKCIFVYVGLLSLMNSCYSYLWVYLYHEHYRDLISFAFILNKLMEDLQNGQTGNHVQSVVGVDLRVGQGRVQSPFPSMAEPHVSVTQKRRSTVIHNSVQVCIIQGSLGRRYFIFVLHVLNMIFL